MNWAFISHGSKSCCFQKLVEKYLKLSKYFWLFSWSKVLLHPILSFWCKDNALTYYTKYFLNWCQGYIELNSFFVVSSTFKLKREAWIPEKWRFKTVRTLVVPFRNIIAFLAQIFRECYCYDFPIPPTSLCIPRNVPWQFLQVIPRFLNHFLKIYYSPVWLNTVSWLKIWEKKWDY